MQGMGTLDKSSLVACQQPFAVLFTQTTSVPESPWAVRSFSWMNGHRWFVCRSFIHSVGRLSARSTSCGQWNSVYENLGFRLWPRLHQSINQACDKHHCQLTDHWMESVTEHIHRVGIGAAYLTFPSTWLKVFIILLTIFHAPRPCRSGASCFVCWMPQSVWLCAWSRWQRPRCLVSSRMFKQADPQAVSHTRTNYTATIPEVLPSIIIAPSSRIVPLATRRP